MLWSWYLRSCSSNQRRLHRSQARIGPPSPPSSTYRQLLTTSVPVQVETDHPGLKPSAKLISPTMKIGQRQDRSVSSSEPRAGLKEMGKYRKWTNMAKVRRGGMVIENDAGRRYRGVSSVLARPFPSYRVAAGPDICIVRATPDPVYPFIEPTSSPAHPPQPQTSIHAPFPNSQYRFNKL